MSYVDMKQHTLHASGEQPSTPSHSHPSTLVQSATTPQESMSGMADSTVEKPMHESHLKFQSDANSTQNYSAPADVGGEDYSPQMMRYLAEEPLEQHRLIGYISPGPVTNGEDWHSSETQRRH
jgi:hypothetical protein